MALDELPAAEHSDPVLSAENLNQLLADVGFKKPDWAQVKDVREDEIRAPHKMDPIMDMTPDAIAARQQAMQEQEQIAAAQQQAMQNAGTPADVDAQAIERMEAFIREYAQTVEGQAQPASCEFDQNDIALDPRCNNGQAVASDTPSFSR